MPLLILPKSPTGAVAPGGSTGAPASLPHLAGVLFKAYRLTADQGTYSITGQDAGVTRIIRCSGEQGTYSITGQDAALKHGNILNADYGTYSITGQDAATLYGRLLDAAQGTYDLTDAETFLNYSQISEPDTPAPLPHLGLLRGLGYTPVSMSAEQGSYSITGQDAGGVHISKIFADQGAYSATGQVAILTPGGGASSGNPASLPSLGLFPVSGVNRSLTCDPGTYSILGSDGIPDFAVTAEQGSYSITGQDANLAAGWKLTVEQGTYTITGQDSGYAVTGTDRTMPADYGTYDTTGQDAATLREYPVSAEQGFYGLSGQAVIFSFGSVVNYPLAADQGSYSITGQDATLTASQHILQCQTGYYYLDGQAVVDQRVAEASGGWPQAWQMPQRKPKRKPEDEVQIAQEAANAQKTREVLRLKKQSESVDEQLKKLYAEQDAMEAKAEELVLREQALIQQEEDALLLLLVS